MKPASFALAFVFALALLFSGESLPGMPVPVYAIELVIVAAVLLAYKEWPRLPQLWRSLPLNLRYALGLLLVGALFGTIFTDMTRPALGGLKTWVLAPLALTALIALKPARLKIAELALILFAGLEIVSVVVIGDVADRWAGTLISPNYLAMATVPAALICLIRGRDQRAYWWLAGLFGAATVMTASLGGLLALLFGLVWLGWGWLGKRWRPLLGGIALALLAVGGWFVQSRLAVGADNSLASRLEIWQVSYRLTQLYPITGVCIRGFEAAYAQNAVPVLKEAPIEWVVPQPHNVIFGFWLNFGLPGLLALVFLLVWLVERLRQGVILALPLAALLVHGLVDTPYFKTEIVMIFWLLLALALLSDSSKSAPAVHR